MQQYYLALEDAKMAVKIEPKWPKVIFLLLRQKTINMYIFILNVFGFKCLRTNRGKISIFFLCEKKIK